MINPSYVRIYMEELLALETLAGDPAEMRGFYVSIRSRMGFKTFRLATSWREVAEWNSSEASRGNAAVKRSREWAKNKGGRLNRAGIITILSKPGDTHLEIVFNKARAAERGYQARLKVVHPDPHLSPPPAKVKNTSKTTSFGTEEAEAYPHLIGEGSPLIHIVNTKGIKEREDLKQRSQTMPRFFSPASMSEDEKQCYQWAINHPFWSKHVSDEDSWAVQARKPQSRLMIQWAAHKHRAANGITDNGENDNGTRKDIYGQMQDDHEKATAELLAELGVRH